MWEKIVLRPVVDLDSDLLFRWINDRSLVVFNAPYHEVSRIEHDAWFSQVKNQKSLVFFMIDSIKSGASVGSCQLLNIHPIHRSAELQIRIAFPSSQNRGFGTDAVLQLVSYGFFNLNLHRISLNVFATNLRAIRVYEKTGFIFEGLHRQAAYIEGQWVDVVSMAKLRQLNG